MPAQPCLTCRKPTTNGARCPSCSTAYETARVARRGNSYQRGYGSAKYRANRAATIAAQPWCSDCGSTENLTADHIVQPRDGGTADRENLRTLCGPCNSRRGAEQGRRGKGR